MTSKLAGRDPGEIKPGHTKGLIFGPPGVGKTTFCLKFPRPFYRDIEQGADLNHYQQILKAAGGRYLGPADGTLDFDFHLAQADLLATEAHPYKTDIYDSITKLWGVTLTNEQDRLGDKDQFGASKKQPIRQMRRLLNRVNRLDMNVWFVAHETSEWGMVKDQRQEIGKCADCWDKLPYELHLVLQAQKRGTGPGASRVAIVRKSRLTGFPEGDVFPLEYEEFAKRYGKDFIEAPVTPIKLASAEQVAEITRLLNVVKVPPEDVEKVLTKANAENWTELNETQALATIAWLMKKIEKETK